MLWGGAMLGLAEQREPMLLLALFAWVLAGFAIAWFMGRASGLGKSLEDRVVERPRNSWPPSGSARPARRDLPNLQA